MRREISKIKIEPFFSIFNFAFWDLFNCQNIFTSGWRVGVCATGRYRSSILAIPWQLDLRRATALQNSNRVQSILLVFFLVWVEWGNVHESRTKKGRQTEWSKTNLYLCSLKNSFGRTILGFTSAAKPIVLLPWVRHWLSLFSEWLGFTVRAWTIKSQRRKIN